MKRRKFLSLFGVVPAGLCLPTVTEFTHYQGSTTSRWHSNAAPPLRVHEAPIKINQLRNIRTPYEEPFPTKYGDICAWWEKNMEGKIIKILS